MHRRPILAFAVIATVLAACGPGVVTPAFREVPDAVTPGQSFEVRVVGFSGAPDVELCGLPVAIAQADAGGGVTVLSGTVPILPGGACDLVVTTAEASVTVEVDVVELLSGLNVGYFVDGDGRGDVFRFTGFLEGLAAADLFDLTLYETIEDFAMDVAAESAPELMFFSISGRSLNDFWSEMDAYLIAEQGRAVVLTYCSADSAELSDAWGLDLDANTCYGDDEVASFDIASALTAGNDAPLELTMDGFFWDYAFTTTGVEDDVEVFCTDAADPTAVCGVYHRTYPAALAGWLPEAMVGGQDDELLLQLARSLF